MSHLLEQDRTGLFSVVGAPYVGEQHDDTRGHYGRYSDGRVFAIRMAAIWLAVYAVIMGVTILGKAGVGRAVEMATALLHGLGLLLVAFARILVSGLRKLQAALSTVECRGYRDTL